MIGSQWKIYGRKKKKSQRIQVKIYKVDTPSVEGGDINLLLFPIYIFGIFYHEHTLVKMQNYSKKNTARIF